MPDLYHVVTELDPAVAEQLGNAMELRATDPQQHAMLHAYLADLALGEGARVIEIGCGTGAISRVLAERAGAVVGVDPSPVFLARAQHLATGLARVSYRQGDGRHLPAPDGSFDAAILHTVMSHVPEPERVLAEAFRVIAPGGRLAIFDGDYNTMNMATREGDPLQACATAFVSGYVHDPWIVRRLPAMLAAVGFARVQLRSHGYVQITEPAYILSIVDRGASALEQAGAVGAELAAALRSEARRRVAARTFFGHIAYASLIAEKP